MRDAQCSSSKRWDSRLCILREIRIGVAVFEISCYQRSRTSFRSRKPRQAEARLSANQPGLVNALGGGGSGAATRTAEATSPQELLQEFSAGTAIAAATDVAEPGGGFIQPGVYRLLMRAAILL